MIEIHIQKIAIRSTLHATKNQETKHYLNSGHPKISSAVSLVLILYSLLSQFSFSDTTMQLYYASLPGATVLRLQFLAPEHHGTIHLRTA